MDQAVPIKNDPLPSIVQPDAATLSPDSEFKIASPLLKIKFNSTLFLNYEILAKKYWKFTNNNKKLKMH